MPSRKRIPRPTPLASLPPHLIRTDCSICGLEGGWDPARGVVIHPLRANCVVRVSRAVDVEQVAA